MPINIPGIIPTSSKAMDQRTTRRALTGLCSAELKAEHLTAEAVNTYVEPSATFETSNQLLNKINEIWRRSQLDNMHGGIASDCPHRERNGYTGDGKVACSMVMHNFEC